MSQGEAPSSSGRRRAATWIGYLTLAGAVWIGWQVVREAIVDRLPPKQALALAPASPGALARAAESEFAARRYDNAAFLARASLAKAPFNVRALRVAGLSEATTGQPARADDIVTLAGNWSLRDDPSHVWLMQHRLERGDYHSAFAHADTLARRREDLQPRLFALFTAAATQDPRSLPHLAALIAARPPWKPAYLQTLYASPEGLALASRLAVMLQSARHPLSTAEVSELNAHLSARGLFPMMRQVRAGMKRPSTDLILVNGSFAPPSQPEPYEWTLIAAPGVSSEISEDPVRADSALRVETSGFSTQPAVQQLLELAPGAYVFSGQAMTEFGDAAAALNWSIVCYESSAVIARPETIVAGNENIWRSFTTPFAVPASGCTVQVIRLTPTPADHRRSAAAWYDNFKIVPAP